MANRKIRKAIAINELKYWEVAAAIGIADATFSRWLREELPEDKKTFILATIEKLAKEAV